MSLHDPVDPFSTDAITQLPLLSVEASAIWEGFRFDNSLESRLLRLNDVDNKRLPKTTPHIFRLDLQDVPLPDLSGSASSSSSEVGQEPQQDPNEQNTVDEGQEVWILPDVAQRKSKHGLLSWDVFLDKEHEESSTSYISEANPRIFSAILRSSERDVPPKPIKPDALLHATFELAMGRSSALFEWSEEQDEFLQCRDNITASGYSVALLQNFLKHFLEVGTYTRRLNNCFARLDSDPKQWPASRIAFLAVSRSALYAAQEYLEGVRSCVLSLLQLKGTTSRVSALVKTLKEFVDAVKGCQTDSAVVSALTQHVSTASLSHPGMDYVIQHIFSRTLRPLMTRLLDEVGLTAGPAKDREQQAMAREQEGEYFWSAILSPALCQIVMETRQSLQLLQTHALEVSLMPSVCSPTPFASDLEPGYTFDAISNIQSGCVAYEDTMKASFASMSLSAPSTSPSQIASTSSGLKENEIKTPTFARPFDLERGLFDRHVFALDSNKADSVYDQVAAYLDDPEAEISPFQLDYMEAVALSVSPLVTAQHRLLSYSVLRLLFQKHKLLSHLKLQKGFQLLGDGSFSSRITTALFDSDQNSGEGGRRTGSSTGLRLQARHTWPPAGSELRLVLMGILSDSMADYKDLSMEDRSMEDTLSFAIRDMPAEGLEKCRDVNSIHALDFLRLEYKPPHEILELVFSAGILDKYDRIFQHLLRLCRVHSMTQTLLRQNLDHQPDTTGTLPDRKVIIHMHHFVSALADYCHNTAIGVCWKRFEGILLDVETHINNKDYDRTLQLVKSQDYLRALHERTLDKLLHALLLKRRQAGARQILEDLFTLVLRFAAERKPNHNHPATSSDDGTRRDEDHETTMKRFAKGFEAKVVQFMNALRDQGGASARSRQDGGNDDFGENAADEDDNLFDYLLLRLDMFSFWSSDGCGKGD